MTRVRVQYMEPKTYETLGPREFNHEICSLRPYQIIEYDTKAYSFDGVDLIPPRSLSLYEVFGIQPFKIYVVDAISTPYVEIIPSDTPYLIPNEDVWGVQIENIKPDSSLQYDFDMIVYLNKKIQIKFDVEFRN